MIEDTNRKTHNELLPGMKEVKLMAKAIEATPVLKGKDLVCLINDLKRPDNNKSRRERSLKLLLSVSKGN